MKYGSSLQVTPELLASSPSKEEQLIREMAIEIVSKMTLEDLRLHFGFTKVDPHSDESEAKLVDTKTPEHIINMIHDLRGRGMLGFDMYFVVGDTR